MVKKGIKYKKRDNQQDFRKGFMPVTTPNTNPDDIEIGDEIRPIERLKKREVDDH